MSSDIECNASGCTGSPNGGKKEILSRLRNGRGLGRIESIALLLFDFLSSIVSLYVASWGRASWDATSSHVAPIVWLTMLAAVNVFAFAMFQMYNSLWRYASITEALRIVSAVTVGAAVGDFALSLMFGGLSLREYFTAWAVLILLVGGVRMLIRAMWGSQSWRFTKRKHPRLPRTLIVGAGQTGSLTIKRMLNGDEDVHGDPVALVDDDPAKARQRIHGVKVWGTCDQIEAVAKDAEVEQIVLACPSATRAERTRILDLCVKTGLRVLTLPNIRDIPVNGLGKVALQDVNINDLLARDEVSLDLGRMSYVRGKNILVTGGGGSIGSEIVRQLIPAKPRRIVVFDIYENTAYELLHELAPVVASEDIELFVEIGSVTDPVAIRNCFETYQPDVVFHAAAHKHVPLMEDNAREAIINNVFGTRAVALLSDEYHCSHFVLISTDKAVNPTNVMGATKRMCEMEVQSLAKNSKTVFAAVRFGNVLGSHGSVIPLFRRQLKEGGPLTLTHVDITRYFMTIPEAARLVITAGAQAKGGEIFILKMGEPVRIYDLATKLISLSGLKLGRDIDIKVTGLRPGEKLYEELQMDGEEPVATINPDILVSKALPLEAAVIEELLALLEDALNEQNDVIKRALAEAVGTYQPQFQEEKSA